MKKKYVACAAALLLCVGLTPARSQDNLFNFLTSLDLALSEVNGAQLVKGRGEGAGLFGFYFYINGRLIEIEVRNPGKVIKNKDVEEIPNSGPVNPKVMEMLKVRAKTKLPVTRYIEIALEQGKGSGISSFNLVPNGDRLYIEVGVEGGQTVTMDDNGKIVTK